MTYLPSPNWWCQICGHALVADVLFGDWNLTIFNNFLNLNILLLWWLQTSGYTLMFYANTGNVNNRSTLGSLRLNIQLLPAVKDDNLQQTKKISMPSHAASCLRVQVDYWSPSWVDVPRYGSPFTSYHYCYTVLKKRIWSNRIWNLKQCALFPKTNVRAQSTLGCLNIF